MRGNNDISVYTVLQLLATRRRSTLPDLQDSSAASLDWPCPGHRSSREDQDFHRAKVHYCEGFQEGLSREEKRVSRGDTFSYNHKAPTYQDEGNHRVLRPCNLPLGRHWSWVFAGLRQSGQMTGREWTAERSHRGWAVHLALSYCCQKRERGQRKGHWSCHSCSWRVAAAGDRRILAGHQKSWGSHQDSWESCQGAQRHC